MSDLEKFKKLYDEVEQNYKIENIEDGRTNLQLLDENGKQWWWGCTVEFDKNGKYCGTYSED